MPVLNKIYLTGSKVLNTFFENCTDACIFKNVVRNNDVKCTALSPSHRIISLKLLNSFVTLAAKGFVLPPRQTSGQESHIRVSVLFVRRLSGDTF